MTKNYALAFLCTFLFLSANAQVFINEIVFAPEAPNNDGGSTAGEWIELYALTATDISCFVLTDGDWTVTIPDGMSLAADSYITIGKPTYANTPGGNGTTPITVDIETCLCTNGISGTLDLDNAGEFIGLYNPAATPSFVDGVIFESPTSGNLPANAGSIAANADPSTGCSTTLIDIASSAASYVNIGAGSGNRVGIGREINGTGSWDYIGNDDASPQATNRASLPVDLMYFELEKNQNDIVLSWGTSSELNNDYFSIEHSLDGISFEEIGIVEGMGTSELENQYRYIHQDIAAGLHYYRLNQIDFDGKNEFSSIQTIRIEGDGIKIFPTIVGDQLNIQNGENFGKNGFYQVFDLSGRKMESGILEEESDWIEINTSNWHSGYYVIQVIQNNISISKRVIK